MSGKRQGKELLTGYGYNISCCVCRVPQAETMQHRNTNFCQYCHKCAREDPPSVPQQKEREKVHRPQRRNGPRTRPCGTPNIYISSISVYPQKEKEGKRSNVSDILRPNSQFEE